MGKGSTTLLAATLGVCAAMSAAQAPGPEAAPAATLTAAPAGSSAVLGPALDAVRGTLAAVRTDRWKRGSVRDEAGAEIGSISSDLQLNLPPLVRDADAAPGTLSKQIPLVRHVDALYDVLLRVVEAARISAPGDQVDALTDALGRLSKARLALYDRMQDAATTQEKQVIDLHATVARQAALKCPVPPPPPPCPTPVHKAVKKKPVAKAPAKPGTPAPQTAPKTNTPQPQTNTQKPKTNNPQQKPNPQQ